MLNIPLCSQFELQRALFLAMTVTNYRERCSVQWRSRSTENAVPYNDGHDLQRTLFRTMTVTIYRERCSVQWRLRIFENIHSIKLPSTWCMLHVMHVARDACCTWCMLLLKGNSELTICKGKYCAAVWYSRLVDEEKSFELLVSLRRRPDAFLFWTSPKVLVVTPIVKYFPKSPYKQLLLIEWAVFKKLLHNDASTQRCINVISKRHVAISIYLLKDKINKWTGTFTHIYKKIKFLFTFKNKLDP